MVAKNLLCFVEIFTVVLSVCVCDTLSFIVSDVLGRLKFEVFDRFDCFTDIARV